MSGVMEGRQDGEWEGEDRATVHTCEVQPCTHPQLSFPWTSCTRPNPQGQVIGPI